MEDQWIRALDESGELLESRYYRKQTRNRNNGQNEMLGGTVIGDYISRIGLWKLVEMG